jgi:hypothetical protein
LTLGCLVTAAIGLIGLAAVVLSETVLPDLVSEMAAFIGASAGIAAAAAGTFLVWVRLAAGDRPLDAEPAVPATSARRRTTPRPAPRASAADKSARTLLPKRRRGEPHASTPGRRT